MSVVRGVLRGTGELLVTTGLVLLLFCVYQLVWTNVEAQRQQDQVAERIADDWRQPRPVSDSSDSSASAEEPPPLRLGKGFAFIRIPRLGEDYNVPIVEGVRKRDLSRGVGHYPRTPRPGEVGNVGIAGHRATNGEPFRDLDRMRRGDAVVIETDTTWLTYVVDRTRIVGPDDVWVLDPVPGKPQAEPSKPLLTLTTCHPRWASTQRLIVFTHLAETTPKSAGRPAALAMGR